MDTQDSLTEPSTMGYAITTNGASQSTIDALAVSCLCWRMNYFMQDYMTYQKKQLMSVASLLAKCMIYLPNNLPDMDEEVPWYEQDDE
jgi:hypothetical protein